MDSNSDYDSDINEEFIQYGGSRDNSKFSDSVGRVFILDAKKDGDSDVVITPDVVIMQGEDEKQHIKDTENFIKFFNNTNTEETTLYTKMDNSYNHPMNTGANDSFMILPGIVKDMSSVKLAQMLEEGKVKGINSRTEFLVIAPGITYNPLAYDRDKYWRIFSQLKNYTFNISEDLLFIFDNNHKCSVEEIKFNEITDNHLELINKDINEPHKSIAEKIFAKLKKKTLKTDEKTLSSIIIVKDGRPLINVETAAATAGTPPSPTPEGTAGTGRPPTPESPLELQTAAEPPAKETKAAEATAAGAEEAKAAAGTDGAAKPPEPQAAAAVTDGAAEPQAAAVAQPTTPEQLTTESLEPPVTTTPQPSEATAPATPPAKPPNPEPPNPETPQPSEATEAGERVAITKFADMVFKTLNPEQLVKFIKQLTNKSGQAGGSHYKLNKSKSKKIKRIKIYKKNTKKHKKKLKNTKKRNVRNTKKR